VKLAITERKRTGFFSVAGRFCLKQVLEIKDTQDYEISPLKTGFPSIQLPFNAGFAVINEYEGSYWTRF
jgi:hypothetical protein